MALIEETMEIDPVVVVVVVVEEEEDGRSRAKTLQPQELPPNRGKDNRKKEHETYLAGFELIEHGYRHLVDKRGDSI
ncbi:hypothetical protein MGYG_08289 [Nannizzia gypsea CBS 118893]|uniref:Uncharacterized protein n=1 Tax=Arthroderma gypseum (strain ATCC MYA-4604 / CBS 118893) TaxID=535722 RepID=E4V695_ARTGP|nr:hypothetical protein MGYG_08289 [Nannizzia gypsea CBS 118893]EFR05278.1 hypothetical protein MGYG_08289 [Nannizzia gypsea CBS 118893]